MYEAVDLGPSRQGKRDQISFYDDGVGTSGFKLLAAFGGAFGWGLKRNVLEIYRYACRNYRSGDHIYGFGFSRGAFTMRLAIALIATQGLVTSNDDAELDRRSRLAYRAFRADFLPRKLQAPTRLLRRLRKVWEERRARRKGYEPYDASKNRQPVIRFVGVWDTVAAYGGPIAEITRAIDNWIYPLSMPDYELNEKVQLARHALSLDDERDAFQPLLWDEVHEDSLIKRGKVKDDRLQQVWFTGMHADVGGGYPDESLSFVSLLWMMEEAKKADLRILDVIKDRFVALANSYGPLHNSRSGLGSYYRYQPRKIAAWIDPLDEHYRMLQDPDVAGPNNPEHGLLRRVHVHESVLARIDSGTDRYAPIALPEHFAVFPPQKQGETVAQADSDTGKAAKKRASAPLIGPHVRPRLAASSAARFACQENLWDFVWRRRIAYFATLAATLLLVVMPLWAPLSFLELSCSDKRCVLQDLIGSGEKIAPGFADPWIDAFSRNSVTTLLLVVAIGMLLRWGKSIEGRLRDSMYRLWRETLDGGIPKEERCTPTRVRKWRESTRYQKLFRTLKWYFLPAIFGIVMILVILYIPFVVLTQASLAVEETNHHFCPREEPGSLRPLEQATFTFDTQSSCIATGQRVTQGQVYEVVFQIPLRPDNGDPAPWWDGNRITGYPTGISATGLLQFLAVPMRRMITARYLQPLAQITIDREPKPDALSRLYRRVFPGVDWVDVRPLDLKQDEDWPELYRVRFTAPKNGSLHFFANDAQLPFGWGKFYYENNCGTAQVTITHILPRRRGQEPQQLIEEPSAVVPLPRCAKKRLAALR